MKNYGANSDMLLEQQEIVCMTASLITQKFWWDIYENQI